jgi:predicted dithiol-disulfide oxidoreductase (DUF899 family)
LDACAGYWPTVKDRDDKEIEIVRLRESFLSNRSNQMTKDDVAHPAIVLRDEWLVERKKLLEHEKELTKHHDRVNAERRRLPMVKIEKDYVFDGPNGKQNLKDLFEGRRQLIVYHFMFDPAWEAHRCPGCTGGATAHARGL